MSNSLKCEEDNAVDMAPEWVAYRMALKERCVPVVYRGHYERWVRAWLESDVRHSRSTDPAQAFSSWLEAYGRPVWQCRQAYQAVQIWSSLEPPDPIVPVRDWGQVLDRFRSSLQEKHYSANTVSTYTDWGRRLSMRFPTVPVDSEEASKQVQDFLHSLVHDLNLAPASLALARNSLAWLVQRVMGFTLVLEDKGRAHHERRLPSVLSPSAVRTLLSGCTDPWDLFFGMQYGCGMRLAELLDLRVHDIDTARGVLTVRSGKGDKDRQIPFPASLRPRLEVHLMARRQLWERDLVQGWARVDLPFALARKRPDADTSWEWQHVFGSYRPQRHPESGELRRWRPLEPVVRQALRDAARRAGVQGRVHPHLLRHCYATHLVEAGVPLREIQDLMGHSRLETTMVYMHIRSPSAARPAVDLLQSLV